MNEKDFCEKVRALVSLVEPKSYQKAAQLGEDIIEAYVGLQDCLLFFDISSNEKENGNDCLGS